MQNAAEEECDPHKKCGKYVFRLPDSHIYKRSCTSVHYCNDANRMCESIMQAQDCEVHCCEDDLCNHSSKDFRAGWPLVMACLSMVVVFDNLLKGTLAVWG